MSTDWDIQRIARMVLIVAVAALGIWMLSALLLAFAWGGVLAIATWPVREWLASKRMGNVAIATLLTLVFAAVLLVPLVVLGVEAVEAARHIDAKWLVDHSKDALVAAQAWLNDLPYIGQKASAWWQDNVTKPGAVTTLLSTLLVPGIIDPRNVL
ncbi:MAG: AI-2E family transporter [Bradyrhizobium sp.]